LDGRFFICLRNEKINFLPKRNHGFFNGKDVFCYKACTLALSLSVFSIIQDVTLIIFGGEKHVIVKGAAQKAGLYLFFNSNFAISRIRPTLVVCEK
jgi:hypothetical protein